MALGPFLERMELAPSVSPNSICRAFPPSREIRARAFGRRLAEQQAFDIRGSQGSLRSVRVLDLWLNQLPQHYPAVAGWHDKYQLSGLALVGVDSPDSIGKSRVPSQSGNPKTRY